VLITGGAGQMAQAAAPAFAADGWRVTAWDIDTLDIRSHDRVATALRGLRPDAVLNLAAIRDADQCEVDPDTAWETNDTAVRHLADVCEGVGAHLCQISSDYVFGGEQQRPYTETDEAHPLSVYGASKLASEVVAQQGATVVRTAWLAGRRGTNTVRTILTLAADPDRALAFVDDQRGSPTVAEDLAPVLVRLCAERRQGLYHVTNQGDASWYELACHVLASAGHDPGRMRPIATGDLDPPRAAPRPGYSVLDNAALRREAIPLLPDWRDSTRRLVEDIVSGRSGSTVSGTT
jgi:dTDP-4-dehydrorhamnose reductase